jgi:hypothetical protein
MSMLGRADDAELMMGVIVSVAITQRPMSGSRS